MALRLFRAKPLPEPEVHVQHNHADRKYRTWIREPFEHMPQVIYSVYVNTNSCV